MTYDPQTVSLAFRRDDEMYSALPDAPVVATSPRTPIRRRTAARLHALAERLDV